MESDHNDPSSETQKIQQNEMQHSTPFETDVQQQWNEGNYDTVNGYHQTQEFDAVEQFYPSQDQSGESQYQYDQYQEVGDAHADGQHDVQGQYYYTESEGGMPGVQAEHFSHDQYYEGQQQGGEYYDGQNTEVQDAQAYQSHYDEGQWDQGQYVDANGQYQAVQEGQLYQGEYQQGQQQDCDRQLQTGQGQAYSGQDAQWNQQHYEEGEGHSYEAQYTDEQHGQSYQEPYQEGGGEWYPQQESNYEQPFQESFGNNGQTQDQWTQGYQGEEYYPQESYQQDQSYQSAAEYPTWHKPCEEGYGTGNTPYAQEHVDTYVASQAAMETEQSIFKKAGTNQFSIFLYTSFVVCSVVIAVIVGKSLFSGSSVLDIMDEDLDSGSPLKFTTKRDGYDYLYFFSENPNPYLTYKILDGYSGLVEPSADMYLHIFDVESSEDGWFDPFYYKYTICDAQSNDPDDCTTYDYGDSFSYKCTPSTGNYSVVVQEYSASTQAKTARLAHGSLLCMYVRREFRALTQADMNKTMEAMWTMWSTDEDTGADLYGDDFHNYAYLLQYHYFNAAWQDADHIHEGNGFITQHIKMDLIFQASMQAVDPSVTLPYWDFTIENATGLAVWDSPMFTADTFGSLNLPKDMVSGWSYANDKIESGGIADGRWKNFGVDMNTKYADLYSAYGYMRAPWNMNPSNMLTRFTSIDKWLPTCESHYSLLSYSTLQEFLFHVPYGAHASVHGVVGGVYGCDLFDPLLEAGYIIDEQAKLNLCKNWVFYLKEFYRDNLILPRTDCTSVDASGEFSSDYENQDCGYNCVSEFSDMLTMQLKHSVLNSDYECVDLDSMTQDGWDAWKDFICEGDGSKIFGGDHLESASPADPSFWPIHPTLERILHSRFMVGGFDTDEWPTDPINDYVCNKKTCYNTDEATTNDLFSAYSTWDSCCYGHYQDDQILNAPDGDRYSGIGYTNREIMEMTNPTLDSYGMDYIYDKFSWDHCADIGYDFDALLYDIKYNGTGYNETDLSVSSDNKGWRSLR